MDYTNSHHTRAIQNGFIFPLLKPVEIQSCMKDLGVDLTTDELTQPSNHRERLKQLFKLLLQVCAGKNEEDYTMSDSMNEHVQTLDYPELHQECGDLRFYLHLRDLMRLCGYYEFSFRDLHCPTPKRLRSQLSAIINLAKYREGQLSVYAQLNEPRSKAIHDLDEVNEENAELLEELRIAEIDSKTAFAEMSDVLEECERLELEIGEKNEHQSKTREEAEKLKKTANELKDKITTSSWELEEAEAKEAKLRSQIVSSPDRRKSEKLLKTEKLRQAKEALQTLSHNIQTTKTKLFKCNQTKQVLEPTIAVMDEWMETKQQLHDWKTKLQTAASDQIAADKKLSTLRATISEKERQLARTEETTAQLKKNHKLQRDAVSERHESAQSELLQVEKDRRTQMARIEAGEKEVKQLQQQLTMEQQTTEADVQALMADYKTYERQFLERQQKRLDAMAASQK